MQRKEEKQTTFFDIAISGRAVSKRVLETINAVIDFQEPQRLLEATYSRLGRPGHRVSLMLRVMILQHLYGLSDPQAQEQIADRLSFQKFVGLGADEAVPDETSICRFRERMIACDLHERLLEMFNRELEAAGYLLKRTTLVDATLIESSRKRPVSRESVDAGQAPDADARFACKNGKSYYGYKAHVSADGRNQLITEAVLTPANVDDSRVFSQLIDPQTRAVYADKAYDSNANKQWLREHGIANGILKKGGYHIKLTEQDQADNARKSRRRQHIERIFAHFKKWQDYRRVRYLGLVKNQLELTLKSIAYNFKRLAALASA
jgi:IS5 family transposase